MKKFNCIIVDDEPLAISLIMKHVKLIPELELIDTCSSAMEAFSTLQRNKIDLLFLDIQMPVMTGKEFLESVVIRPEVILTTAYRDYAIESYNWNVLDYLLKPISFPRFLQAVQKFLELKEIHINNQTQQLPGHLFVNVNKKQTKVIFKEVIYIESLKDYLRIHTNNSSIVTKEKISVIDQKLPSQFLRVHRSYILNKNYIMAFTPNEIELQSKVIPIGISYKNEIEKKLKSD